MRSHYQNQCWNIFNLPPGTRFSEMLIEIHVWKCLRNDGHFVSASMCQGITVYPKNMHTVFVLLCFVVVIHWLIFPYPSGLLHWHCGNLTIAPVPAKQPWWIWINTSCEFIMNDCITTTKQSTTKPCAYFLGYTVYAIDWDIALIYRWELRLCPAVLYNTTLLSVASLREL